MPLPKGSAEWRKPLEYICTRIFARASHALDSLPNGGPTSRLMPRGFGNRNRETIFANKVRLRQGLLPDAERTQKNVQEKKTRASSPLQRVTKTLCFTISSHPASMWLQQPS